MEVQRHRAGKLKQPWRKPCQRSAAAAWRRPAASVGEHGSFSLPALRAAGAPARTWGAVSPTEGCGRADRDVARRATLLAPQAAHPGPSRAACGAEKRKRRPGRLPPLDWLLERRRAALLAVVGGLLLRQAGSGGSGCGRSAGQLIASRPAAQRATLAHSSFRIHVLLEESVLNKFYSTCNCRKSVQSSCSLQGAPHGTAALRRRFLEPPFGRAPPLLPC